MPQLEPVDLVLTDPPYGIGIANNPFRQKYQKQDWDNEPPAQEVFSVMFNISKYQVFWGGNYFNLPPSQGFFVWDKIQPEKFSSSMCEFAWTNKQQPAKLFRQHVVSYTKEHPTQKPEPLMIWCLGFFEEATTVLDPFLGSGTTAVACERLNRKWIGIEISEEYCEIAAKRIDAENRQLKLF
jgi:DNA modification methylase